LQVTVGVQQLDHDSRKPQGRCQLARDALQNLVKLQRAAHGLEGAQHALGTLFRPHQVGIQAVKRLFGAVTLGNLGAERALTLGEPADRLLE
jgi:hypothetical protein